MENPDDAKLGEEQQTNRESLHHFIEQDEALVSGLAQQSDRSILKKRQ